jgi:RING finger protein 113A
MADTAAPIVKFKKRGAKAAPRKPAPQPTHSSISSDSASDSDDADSHIVKRRKLHTNALKASTADQQQKSTFEGATKYAADHSTVLELSNDATKSADWYEETADDTLSKKNLLGSTRALPKPSSTEKEDANAAPERKVVGPQKAPSTVRIITMVDYTPDVCKDYKQTGFCGFGDNCKFLHAREDYAAGWKLDKEWEVSGKGKKPSGTVVASANREGKPEKDEDGVDLAMLEKIPFACIICKKPYRSPIITKCGHYFCEACALKRYRKDPTCANCAAKTYGVFNGARNLQKLLDKKQKVEDRKKAEEEAAKAAEEAGDGT